MRRRRTLNGADDVLHWIAWSRPAKTGGRLEGALPEDTVSGTADVGRDNEGYALNRTLDLPVDATRAQLLDALKDGAVAKAAHVARFRQRASRADRRAMFADTRHGVRDLARARRSLVSDDVVD
jgi:hypothetical protein